MSVFDVLNEYVFEPAGNIIDSTADFVSENPIKTVAIVATTVATGGASLALAGPIAATAGGAGLLGATSTGTAISTLSGAALTNASLAALGGGSLAAGGTGMAGGSIVVAATGAGVGAVGSSKIAANT